MTTSDDFYSESSSPAPTGLQFLTQDNDVKVALADLMVFRTASVAGTDTITADAAPLGVPASLPTGLKLTLEPVNTTTSATPTLNVDGTGAVTIVKADGSALDVGELEAGTVYLLFFDGTNYRVVNTLQSSAGQTFSRTVYDTSDTWTNNVAPTAQVRVQLWAAGAGGQVTTGGGGGGYAEAWFVAGDLGATETISVASAPSAGVDGGNTSFGAHLTAYGGATGGGGGGTNAAGSGGTGGSVGGGDAPSSQAGNNYAGGAGGTSGGTAPGGDAVYGGGGGAFSGVTAGVSTYGGNGGTAGNPGSRPGGGGGSSASGGAGRAIITVFGG